MGSNEKEVTLDKVFEQLKQFNASIGKIKKALGVEHGQITDTDIDKISLINEENVSLQDIARALNHIRRDLLIIKEKNENPKSKPEDCPNR